MDCPRRVGVRCKDAAHFNQICGRLRPWICETRKRIEAAREREKARIREGRTEEPLGIGA